MYANTNKTWLNGITRITDDILEHFKIIFNTSCSTFITSWTGQNFPIELLDLDFNQRRRKYILINVKKNGNPYQTYLAS